MGLPGASMANYKRVCSQFLLVQSCDRKSGPTAAGDDNHLREPKCIRAFTSLEISWLFNICTDFSLHLHITPLTQL